MSSRPIAAAATAVATRASVPAAARARPAQGLETQQREADAHQALIELFPHLRHEAYNALRELFPTPASAQ